MVSDSASWEACSSSSSNSSPSPEISAGLLVTTALGSWPDPLTQRLVQWESISIESLSSSALDPHTLLLLGYQAPASILATLLSQPKDVDILATLERWRIGCLRMLELRRQRSDQCLLINLSHLDSSAQAQLLQQLQVRGLLATDEDHPSTGDERVIEPFIPPPLPQVVAHYLDQRSDLSQLYADLEGYVELLGRDPEFANGAPLSWGLPLAELLLWEWLDSRSQHLRRCAELQNYLSAAQLDCATLERLNFTTAEQFQQVRDQTSAIQIENEQLLLRNAAEAQRANAAAARLRDVEEQLDLAVQQQKQLQDELRHAFHEGQLSTRQCEALQERLATQESLNQVAKAELASLHERVRALQFELEQSCIVRNTESQRADNAHSRLQQIEEQRQQAMLQQRQLQEELSHYYLEYQNACASSDDTSRRLARLEQECLVLFLNSRLNAGLDPRRFETILSLVRDSLHV